MLLDTASMYFRAFFGVPDSFKAPDGTPVNAVRGLLDFISRLVTRLPADPPGLLLGQRLAPAVAGRPDPVVQGAPGGVRRRAAAPDVEEVPDPLEAQVPVILDVLAAFGIAVVGADGYEADDVIGTLATDAGMPVDVVTGDRDLFQLVDDERRGAGALHRPRRRPARAGHQRRRAGEVRRRRLASTPTSPPCAATPPTACPG